MLSPEDWRGSFLDLIVVSLKDRYMTRKQGFYEKYIKRPQDFLCALLAIVALGPVLLLTALSVRIKLGSPVIFRHERAGLMGKPFRLWKFRSMTDERDADGNLLPDEARLTEFGKMLRSTSLDELASLVNILKGEIAVVGPRPLPPQYVERYTKAQARRLEVRPGLTGLAQVHGRNAISWEEKFRWDIRYIDSLSFMNDWKIIWDTIGVVLGRAGIHSETSPTMEEFMGTVKTQGEL